MPSKYLSIFLKALEMPLINCEINLNLAWSENSVIRYAIGEKKIKITDIKLYVPLVTLSIQDNANAWAIKIWF